MGGLGDVVPAAGDVAALAEHLRAVGIGELDEVVVEDLADAAVVADLRSRPCRWPRPDDRSSTQLQTSRLWTCCSQMLSPQSQAKWYQLSHLVLHLGRRLLRGARIQIAAAVPVGPQEQDVADRAVVDLLDRLRGSCGLVAALQARRRPSGPSRRPACWPPSSVRKPAASVQQGFSMKTCLPALMAAA